METIWATLWIYRTALVRSAQLLSVNWRVIFAPLAYGVILSVSFIFFAWLPIVGGIAIALITDACISSGLYLTENILDTRKATLHDFTRGFGVYLWDVVLIFFILWIPMMVARSVLIPVPNGYLFLLFIQLTLYIILNAVPELIYQSRTSGLDLLAASYHFITENWIEWLIPNLAIAVGGYFVWDLLDRVVLRLPSLVQFFVIASSVGLFLTYFMIFRGILFAELNGSTARSRAYRYKTRDSI